MELTELIKHPEQMNRDTLYELRSLLALYPYFQTARLLMLQNLYLLHDASFDEELRKAAIYITDRKTLFQLVEAAHYQLRTEESRRMPRDIQSDSNRTVTLIDSFLDSIPQEEEDNTAKKRRPTPADAAVDYVSYLLAIEGNRKESAKDSPQMKGQSLIDSFLEQEQGRILLNELPETPADNAQQAENNEENVEVEEEYFTETLARIYIKQGRYQKALDIIGRLSRQHPQKNVYFADQMRFLEKLIINNKVKN